MSMSSAKSICIDHFFNKKPFSGKNVCYKLCFHIWTWCISSKIQFAFLLLTWMFIVLTYHYQSLDIPKRHSKFATLLVQHIKNIKYENDHRFLLVTGIVKTVFGNISYIFTRKLPKFQKNWKPQKYWVTLRIYERFYSY